MFKRTIFGLVATSFIGFLVMSLPGCGGGGGGGGAAAGGGGTATGISLLAGSIGGDGSSDGTGANAGFRQLRGMATDSAGNMYVADKQNNTIRKITPAGVVTTLAGSSVAVAGLVNGTGTAATFNAPYGVAADNAGNLYVADTNNNAVRKIVISTGVVTTLATGLNGPRGVAVDSLGNVYVTNKINGTISKIAPPVGGASAVVSTFSSGYTGSPFGIAIDGTGSNLYVTMTVGNNIYKIAASGAASSVFATGFIRPKGVALDSKGNLYVANGNGSNTISIVNASGVVGLLAGSSAAAVPAYADGTGQAALFYQPVGVTVDSSGNVYVADARNFVIRKISPYSVSSSSVVSTFVGAAPVRGHVDATGAAAKFDLTKGIAADSSGNLYVADWAWWAPAYQSIRKITPAGVVTTLAGSSVTGSANGTGAAATFNWPNGLTVDSAGNIYVAENSNNDIRKITPAGVVTTLATGLSRPKGMVVDSSGNVYVANNGGNNVLLINASGVVSTYATGFNAPSGLARDSKGNLYVVNHNGNTISFVATPVGAASAVVSTYAGSGTLGYANGSGAAAMFNRPEAIVLDSATGNLYVAYCCNNVIRKITPATASASAVVSTVVGVATPTPTVWGSGKGFTLGALPGKISTPRSLAISGGKLYITTRFGVLQVSSLP